MRGMITDLSILMPAATRRRRLRRAQMPLLSSAPATAGALVLLARLLGSSGGILL